MKLHYVLALAALLGVKVHACEFAAGAGKTAPANGAHSTGTLDVGCRWEKLDLGFTYMNEAIVDDGSVVPRMYLLHVARAWRLGHGWEAVTGAVLKQSDQDHNSKLPLALGFHLGVGYNLGEWRVQVLHDSNNNLNGGRDRSNQGVNWLRIQWVKR
jgi:hypothetical protein